jgi:hypothetical protein
MKSISETKRRYVANQIRRIVSNHGRRIFFAALVSKSFQELQNFEIKLEFDCKLSNHASGRQAANSILGY